MLSDVRRVKVRGCRADLEHGDNMGQIYQPVHLSWLSYELLIYNLHTDIWD